jgi:hypothetical protein
MSDQAFRSLASGRQWTSLAFLIGGVAAFVSLMCTEIGREIFPQILEALLRPKDINVQQGLVISSFLTFAAVTIASPALFAWLPFNRLMRVLLRVFSGLIASIFGYFCLEYGVEGEAPLVLLVIGPFLTFVGLLLITPAPPAAVPEH